MTPDTSASVAASLPGPAPGEVIGEAPGPGGPPIGLPGNDGLPGSGPPGVIGGVGGSGGGTMYSRSLQFLSRAGVARNLHMENAAGVAPRRWQLLTRVF